MCGMLARENINRLCSSSARGDGKIALVIVWLGIFVIFSALVSKFLSSFVEFLRYMVAVVALKGGFAALALKCKRISRKKKNRTAKP